MVPNENFPLGSLAVRKAQGQSDFSLFFWKDVRDVLSK